MICKACGTVNSATRIARGSGFVELVLWVTFVIPIALVYTVWRRTNLRPTCSACGSQELVALATPVGRRLASQYHPDGVRPVAAPPARPAATLRGVGRLLVLLGAGIVGTFVLALVVGPLLG